MSLIARLNKIKIIPAHKLLEIYPPFFFMGVKIKHVSPNYDELFATLPLRWYAKNLNGTMFGGHMCALPDPLPALMCGRIFKSLGKDLEVWTKKNTVDFLRPGKGVLSLEIKITPEQINEIKMILEREGKATYVFTFSYWSKDRKEIARVENTVYLKDIGQKK